MLKVRTSYVARIRRKLPRHALEMINFASPSTRSLLTWTRITKIHHHLHLSCCSSFHFLYHELASTHFSSYRTMFCNCHPSIIFHFKSRCLIEAYQCCFWPWINNPKRTKINFKLINSKCNEWLAGIVELVRACGPPSSDIFLIFCKLKKAFVYVFKLTNYCLCF